MESSWIKDIENPFSPGDRVICTSPYVTVKGMTGIVTQTRGDEIFVKIDGESLSWNWHWTHFEHNGPAVTNYSLWQ